MPGVAERIHLGECCGVCSYSIEAEEKGAVICKRFPPQIVVSPDTQSGAWTLSAPFPRLSEIDWCGEFKRA